MFRKILVANRGEVSARILRTCRSIGVRCATITTDADKDLGFLSDFDEVYNLGDRREYLNMDKIIQVARENQISAIHPGWGFLSENSTFASMCKSVGIHFVGPSANVMRLMGDKAQARDTMAKLDLHPIPGVDGIIENLEKARDCANRIGYPILLKAVSGGGGKGMRIVESEDKLADSLNAAKAEAISSFGDGSIYMEKLIQGGRHIEFQVLCDRENAYVLGERECSIQRRHQKLLEETPSVAINQQQRKEMVEKISQVCLKIGYMGAGTIEMLQDRSGNVYFMEMNTRLQVEHSITEEIASMDLVLEQLNVAANKRLDVDFSPKGHSIQCRVNAEDIYNDFRPIPGKITKLKWPDAQGVRVDTHLEEGDSVSPHYDSMIAKLIVHADTRTKAIEKMIKAIEETVIEGVPTTLPLHLNILRHQKFQSGDYDTKFLENNISELLQ